MSTDEYIQKFTITYDDIQVYKLTFETNSNRVLEIGMRSESENETDQVFTFDGETSQLIGMWTTMNNITINALGALYIDLEYAELHPFSPTITVSKWEINKEDQPLTLLGIGFSSMLLACSATGLLAYIYRLKKQKKNPWKEMHIMKVFKRLGLRRKQKVKPDQPVQKNSTR